MVEPSAIPSGWFVRFMNSREGALGVLDEVRFIRENPSLVNEEEREQLIEKIRRTCVQESHELSLYNSISTEPRSLGHSMAVVAVTIARGSWKVGRTPRKKYKKDFKSEKKACTLLFDACQLSAASTMDKTPDGCTSFWPARDFHWDLRFGEGCRHSDADAVAQCLMSFWLRNVEGFRLVAVNVPIEYQDIDSATAPFADMYKVVCDHCHNEWGLGGDSHPRDWEDLPSLDAKSQYDRISNIASVLEVI